MAKQAFSIGACLSKSWNTLVRQPRLWLMATLLSLGVYLIHVKAFNASALSSLASAQSFAEFERAESFPSPSSDAFSFFREFWRVFLNHVELSWLIVALVCTFVGATLLKAGWAETSIKAAYGEPLCWKDFFRPMARLRTVICFAISSLLVSLLIVVATVLPSILSVLILPSEFPTWPAVGVALLLAALLLSLFALWPYLAIRLKLGPIQALRAAVRVSRGGRLSLLGLIVIFAAVEYGLGMIPEVGAFLAIVATVAWSNLAFGEATKSLLTQVDS